MQRPSKRDDCIGRWRPAIARRSNLDPTSIPTARAVAPANSIGDNSGTRSPTKKIQMRSSLIGIAAFIAMFVCVEVHAAEAADLKDAKQKLSYALGSQVAAGLKKQGVDIDPKAFAAGLTDA